MVISCKTKQNDCVVIDCLHFQQHGCYRAAIDLTAQLLAEAGQDVLSEAITMHSPETLQVHECAVKLGLNYLFGSQNKVVIFIKPY